MDVILRDNFPSLGYVGDKVKVRRGYARNFLIPRGIVVEAGSRNASIVKHQLTAINARKQKLKAEAEQIAQRISQTKLSFTVKATESGKSFGAITQKDIENALAEKGFVLDRKQIRITDQIKAIGDHTVYVKLHSEVTANVTVVLEADASAVVPNEKKDKAPKGRRSSSRKASEDNKEAESGAENNTTTEEAPKKGKGRSKKTEA